MKCSLKNAVHKCIMLHFILVFTVCKSFHLGFPEYKGLINVINGFFSVHLKLPETEGPQVRASPASLRCGP